MAAQKRLQAEIDKLLKKVDEGVEEYNRLRDSHNRASQPNQKEKIEENLKAQIKKLQRDRNQLSTWITDKQVKDKGPLTSGKNKIEGLMDHFKDFERESKTKRFSQVGLNKEDRADPEEQKRREMIVWIQDMVSELEKEFDELTAAEQLMNKKPAKNSKEEANLAFNKKMLDSHRWHITKLEQINRKLSNEDAVDLDSLDILKDSLQQYMDDEVNPRSTEQFIDYAEVYDDFNLEEVEDYLAAGREKEDEKEEEEVPVKKEEPSPAPKPKEPAKHKSPTVSVHPRQDDKPVEKVAPPKQIATRTPPTQVLSHPTTSQAPPPHVLPSPGPAPAAPASVPAATVLPAPKGPPPQRPPTTGMGDQGAPSVPPPSKPPPGPGPEPNVHEPPAQPPPPPPSLAPPPAPGPGPKRPPNTLAGPGGVRPSGPPPPPNEAPPVPQQDPGEGPPSEPQLAYADIPPLTEQQERAHALFEASAQFLPLPCDVRKSRRYSPMIPHVHADRSERPMYPQEPLRSVDDPAFFERLDVDTLFFIFYFQQGTYQQYLAAKELKKASWRYHTKYLTWFQRHEEPRLTAPEFERGTYVFFDFETQWTSRLKQDFTFEYAWLEPSDV